MDLPKLCTTRLCDQNFGMCISPQDILVPFFSNSATNYYRPWKLCEEIAKKDFGSTIDDTKENFKITLDVQHFRPEEVSVKVNDKEIIIEGKHDEKQDDHGFISRQFVRRYMLPKDCLSESVSSTLSSDGILCITANKKICKEIKDVKTVSIKMAGPCRKTDITNNGENKDEMKMDVCEKKKDKCDIRKDMCVTKKDKCEINKNADASKNEAIELKKDQCKIKNGCEMKKDQCNIRKDKCEKQRDCTETQSMLKEEHSRLLKPELLGEAISGTEKLISESRKETDELLRLMSEVQTMPKPTEEKLDLAIGQCKAAMKELKKDKGELNMAAISEMEGLTSSGMAMGSSEISSTKKSTEISSMQSSMITETIEMSMSSNTKATSEKTCDIVSEIICAELKEAAAETT